MVFNYNVSCETDSYGETLIYNVLIKRIVSGEVSTWGFSFPTSEMDNGDGCAATLDLDCVEQFFRQTGQIVNRTFIKDSFVKTICLRAFMFYLDFNVEHRVFGSRLEEFEYNMTENKERSVMTV